jgi:hypothetical protein
MIAALLTGLSVVTLGAGVTPAVADPRGEPIQMMCDELGQVGVVVNGNGAATPGHVVGSVQIGIPYALHVTFDVTPVVGEPFIVVDTYKRPAPNHGRLDHCTFHDEFSNESASFVVDGEVWISYTPLH